MESEDIRAKYEKLAEFLEDNYVCPGRYGGLYLAGDESYWVEYDADAVEPGWKVFENE